MRVMDLLSKVNCSREITQIELLSAQGLAFKVNSSREITYTESNNYSDKQLTYIIIIEFGAYRYFREITSKHICDSPT